MIGRFEKYLEIVNERWLQKFFEQQKDYINCKSGCSLCCESGQYPFSELELKYAMLGYSELQAEDKIKVQRNFDKILNEREVYFQNNPESTVFMHQCPFLIDKKCSIYKYRGLICRTHGLMYYFTNKKGEIENKAPGCMKLGLNYSNVYDPKMGTISLEMWENTKIETEPMAYNLGREYILNNPLTKELELVFGEDRALIEWFL